jgi:hypothetical protein
MDIVGTAITFFKTLMLEVHTSNSKIMYGILEMWGVRKVVLNRNIWAQILVLLLPIFSIFFVRNELHLRPVMQTTCSTLVEHG